jgi:hypothetical protein
MGQQQLLLIVLAVLIVGIAMFIGVTLFTAHSIESNRDAIIADLGNLSAHAYEFYIRPVSMGGGGGDFKNYFIPAKMAVNENATYSVISADNKQIKFTGESISNPNSTVTTTFQVATGKDSAFTFDGVFAP